MWLVKKMVVWSRCIWRNRRKVMVVFCAVTVVFTRGCLPSDSEKMLPVTSPWLIWTLFIHKKDKETQGGGLIVAEQCISVCGGGRSMWGRGGFAVLCVEQRSPTLAEWALSSGFLWQTKILSPAVGVYGNWMSTVLNHLAVITCNNTLQLTHLVSIFTLFYFCFVLFFTKKTQYCIFIWMNES